MTNLLIKLFIKNKDHLSDNEIRHQYGILGGVVGVICNFLLFILKIIAGILTSSIAIMADAFNNLSDAASSIITVVGFKMVNKPADKEHPFGHGRVEYISGLIISMIIIMMGLEFIKSSIEHIITHEITTISTISITILIISITLKLWMSIFNKKLGKIIHSSTMKAISMDSLVDVVATSTTLICLIISYYTNVSLDGYAGIIVALFIIYTGYSMLKETLDPLLGSPPDMNFVKKVEDFVLSHNEILGIHDLIVHNYGANRIIVTLHAEVPCDINIITIHEIVDNIERTLKKDLDCEVLIHIDPIITNDEEVLEIRDMVLNIIKSIDENLTMHDFRMVKNNLYPRIIFDIVIPHNFNMTNESLISTIEQLIRKNINECKLIINIDDIYSYNQCKSE